MRRLCSATGARSVSDLTRDAMRALIAGSAREGSMGSYADEFRAQIHYLDQRIEELATRIAPPRPESEG